MRKLWKYRKKILYNEYVPKSQLHIYESSINMAKYPVIDAHTHFGCHIKREQFETKYETKEIIKKLKNYGIKRCVELTIFDRDNWKRVHKKVCGYEDFFTFCAPIDLSKIGKNDFEEWIYHEMEAYVKEGAAGFKVWKDLGLSLFDENGRRIPIDSEKLDFIWDKAAELNRPVVIHVADPPAYFEPADQFNERLEEIMHYHFWHHYQKGLHFIDYMKQLDHLLERHAKTIFLAAHLCSYPSDLDFVSDLMRRHDNLYTDIAAVLSEIGRQPRRFYRFVYEFPERILFGTDFFASDISQHLPYFRFLETEDEYFPYNTLGNLEHGRWQIYGCGLDDELLKNIYYKNAEKFFKIGDKGN